MPGYTCFIGNMLLKVLSRLLTGFPPNPGLTDVKEEGRTLLITPWFIGLPGH